MKYEFGVMSNKWSLVADDDTTAFVSMSLFIGQDIPIAVYTPKQQVLSPIKVLEEDFKAQKKFTSTTNRDKIKTCMSTIVKVI
jgi:hypothetical protein